MAPDHIAELALIETSRLQRYVLAFSIDDETAQAIAADCEAELERRDALARATQEREAA